jgi:hypothetical protein
VGLQRSRTWVLEVSNSNPWSQIQDVVLEARGLEKFSGSNLNGLSHGPVSGWAGVRLIHDPTVTPQFPCPEDYGNSSVPEE